MFFDILDKLRTSKNIHLECLGFIGYDLLSNILYGYKINTRF